METMILERFTLASGILTESVRSEAFVHVGDDRRVKRTVEALRRLMVVREQDQGIAFDHKMLTRAESIIAVFCKRTEGYDDYIVKAGLGAGDELTVILTKMDYQREISVDFSPDSSNYFVFKTESPLTTETEIHSLNQLSEFVDWVFGKNGD